MKTRIFILSLGLIGAIPTHALIFNPGIDYPIKPNTELTPGSQCQRPTYLRHPERIPYCDRDVESSMKKEIIAEYDMELRYRIRDMDRAKFKIDHLIPLCIGGSNNKDNLWPQHESLFVNTDNVEHKTCEWMSLGKIKQKDAINLVLKAKNDPAHAIEILNNFKFVEKLSLFEL